MRVFTTIICLSNALLTHATYEVHEPGYSLFTMDVREGVLSAMGHYYSNSYATQWHCYEYCMKSAICRSFNLQFVGEKVQCTFHKNNQYDERNILLSPADAGMFMSKKHPGCDKRPCLHGTCTPTDANNYQCSCEDGYEGNKCDAKIQTESC